MPCPQCKHECTSLNVCIKYQEFNELVEQARAIVALKKHIKMCIPHFQGKQSWLKYNPKYEYKELLLSDLNPIDYNYRFMTLTFDPAKFSYNELTQPEKLHNYMLNALYDIRHLFTRNIILVREYHKSGVPHYHLNYTTHDTNTLIHLKLRMQYYLAKSLRNKFAVHDRIFNAGGIEYLKKANDTYFAFMTPPGEDQSLQVKI